MKRLHFPVQSLNTWSDLRGPTTKGRIDDIDVLGYQFRNHQTRVDCFVSRRSRLADEQDVHPELRNTQSWLKRKLTGDALLDYC